MKHFLASLWWWIRVLVLVTVGLYALALLWKNSKQTASIWYWPGRPVEETSVIALAVAAFFCGGLIMTISWALFTATVNLRRTRAARKKRAEQLAREEMERKASMLRVKPAPTPMVKPRIEPKSPRPTEQKQIESKPEPLPEVEPTPEMTLAPAPVVVRPVETPKPAEPPKVVEKIPVEELPTTPTAEPKPTPPESEEESKLNNPHATPQAG